MDLRKAAITARNTAILFKPNFELKLNKMPMEMMTNPKIIFLLNFLPIQIRKIQGINKGKVKYIAVRFVKGSVDRAPKREI